MGEMGRGFAVDILDTWCRRHKLMLSEDALNELGLLLEAGLEAAYKVGYMGRMGTQIAQVARRAIDEEMLRILQ